MEEHGGGRLRELKVVDGTNEDRRVHTCTDMNAAKSPPSHPGFCCCFICDEAVSAFSSGTDFCDLPNQELSNFQQSNCRDCGKHLLTLEIVVGNLTQVVEVVFVPPFMEQEGPQTRIRDVFAS